MDPRVWDQRYAAAELIWTAEPNRFLVAEVDGMAPGTELDLGCGEGRNAIWLASQGWDVIGVDFSRIGLDKAHQLAAQRHVAVEWILADVTTYRSARAAFDLVAILYLLSRDRSVGRAICTSTPWSRASRRAPAPRRSANGFKEHIVAARSDSTRPAARVGGPSPLGRHAPGLPPLFCSAVTRQNRWRAARMARSTQRSGRWVRIGNLRVSRCSRNRSAGCC